MGMGNGKRISETERIAMEKIMRSNKAEKTYSNSDLPMQIQRIEETEKACGVDRWEPKEGSVLVCPHCLWLADYPYESCPNCGAKMSGEGLKC